MKGTLKGLLLLLLLPAALCASSGGATSVFDIGIGVRAQSMGGAFTAGGSDSSSIFYNPAALYTITRAEVQAAYAPLFYDTVYSYAAAALPSVDLGTFGLSFASFSTGNVIFRDTNGISSGTESQTMFEVIAGYSNMLFIPELSAGFNIKFDRQQLAGFADSGFGCDAGLYYEKPLDTDDNISAGLNIKNLIEPSLNLAGSPDNLPRQALLGVSYSRLFGKELKTSFFLDGSVPLGSEFQYNAGMELAIFRTLFIRAGYNSYEISSLGAGLDLFDSVSVDYGFFMTGIDDQHRVSLRMRFGGNMSEARQNRDANENAKIEAKAKKMAAEELEKMKKSIEDLKKDASTKEYFKALHYTKGLEAYFDSDYKRSLAEFETVRNIDDNYLNTRTYLSMLRNILSKSKQENYSDEILKLYRSGVEKYMKQDYKGAKADWEKILKIDPYNKLATDNLKEVNSLLRDIEKIEE